jgi:RsiW-degrading membrane proteinase PrsW (M82 family)
MLVGALMLYVTRQFDEALDGFSFGAAGALGFTAAKTVVNLLPALRTTPLAHVPVLTSLADVLQRGLLVPFINASVTGLIAGALWLRRGQVRQLGTAGWATALPSAVAVAMLVDVILGLSDTLADSLAYAFSVRVIVAAVLVLLVRVSIHHMLLSEAVTAEIGPAVPCSHCHRIVPRMAFCPYCGVAIRATPKTGLRRTARAMR